VWSEVVVVVEPDGQGAGAFGAVGVEARVGPAVEDGLDEALGFAVGAGPAGFGAAVADTEGSAGKRVQM
jgi:hypothetical protein